MDQPSRVLLLADTDATQAYVFESSKLPEIRGASRWLHDLNMQLKGLVTNTGGEVVFAGGGGLLAVVKTAVAATLVAQIEQLYPQRTGAATITAVTRSFPPGDKQSQFGAMVGWLTYALRRKKGQNLATPFWETLPHQVRCPSCQARPALADSAGNWCQVCVQKRTYQGRYAWFQRFVEEGKPPQLYFNHQPITQLEHPQDLSELGQACRAEPGYIAFIYLDGDGIGQLLQKIAQRSHYQKFSETMQQVTETAVFQALANHLQITAVTGSPARAEVGESHLVGRTVHIHPFEIITIGGDDVMLLVPADVAIPIATEIGTQFGTEMSRFVQAELGWPEPVSMSGGIVVADTKTPVRILRDLAKQLQDEAKKEPGGRLDFLVLKSADMLASSVEAVRQQQPYLIPGGDRKTGKDLRLLGRPYRYEQMHTLWQNLHSLKNDKKATLANSQMQLLAKSLLDGRQEATLYYEYQRKRDKSGAYDQLDRMLRTLYAAQPNDPIPWQHLQEDTVSYQTALWDFAELFDFVPKEI